MGRLRYDASKAFCLDGKNQHKILIRVLPGADKYCYNGRLKVLIIPLFMAQRKNYWSCSKLADWIRGTVKGGSKTGSGWREWEVNAKQKHRIRFRIAEGTLDAIQNVIW
jgi:hypothetical protein